MLDVPVRPVVHMVSRMRDTWSMLQARRRTSPGLPLVTYLDTTRGERTELSATSVENAAAKVANALRDEFELEPGAVVALHLPFHWQRSVWCAGIWTAGCIVAVDGDPGGADLIVAGPAEAGTLTGRTSGDIAVVSLHPLGLPTTGALPVGAFDVTLAVRQQPDGYLFEPPTAHRPALRLGSGAMLTGVEVGELALQRAAQWLLAPAGRLLVDDSVDVLDGWLAALAIPLHADASVLMVRGSDQLDRVREQERITAWARSPR